MLQLYGEYQNQNVRGGQQETFASSKAVLEDLNMKFRSKLNHGFTNRGCLHCAILKAYNTAQKMKLSIKDLFNKCDQRKTSFFVQCKARDRQFQKMKT